MRFLKNIGLAVAAIALTLCFTAPAVHASSIDASTTPERIPFLPAGTQGSLSADGQKKLQDAYSSARSDGSFSVTDAPGFLGAYDSLNAADKKLVRDEVMKATNNSIDLDSSLRVPQAIGAFLVGATTNAQSTGGSGGALKSSAPSKNAGGLFKGVSTACWDDGLCTLCDGMVVLINVANAILRLLAIVAVLFFVYGAGLLVISQGNEDLISKGKSTLKATIFGTVIVLLGWQVMSLVVYFVVARSLGPDKTQNVTASSALNWYNVANSCQQQ